LESVLAFRAVLRLAASADAAGAIGAFVLGGLEKLAFPASALGLKMILDAATTGDFREGAGGVAFLCSSMALLFLIGIVGTRLRIRLDEATSKQLDTRMMQLSLCSTATDHLESVTYRNQLALLGEDRSALGNSVTILIESVGLAVRWIAILLLLGSVHPLLLVLPACGIPRLWASRGAQAAVTAAREEAVPHARLAAQVFGLSTASTSSSIEIRVAGLEAHLVDLYRRQLERAQAIRGLAEVRNFVRGALASIVFPLALVGGVGFVANRAFAGDATFGDLLLTLSLAAQVNEGIAASVARARSLQRVLAAAERLAQTEDLVASFEESPVERVVEPVPPAIRRDRKITRLNSIHNR
jgi:ATP-binding cassette subfamily B protein